MARKRKQKKQSHKRKRQQTQRQQEIPAGYIDEEEKTEAILQAIHAQDHLGLRELGQQSGGFLTDSLRRKAWPILLQCPFWKQPPTKLYLAHKDEQQVALDVARSLNIYPKGLDARRKKRLQQELNHVITQVLRKYPKLHYYQGFHDICTVFLLLYRDQYTASRLVGHVALFYLRDAMLESLDPVIRQLNLLYTLFQLEDEELYQFIESWVITWFSHDLDDLPSIFRLFDLFLSSNPMMPLYASASLVLMHRDTILGHFSLDDPSLLHSYLSKLPHQFSSFDMEQWISNTVTLSKKWDPLFVQQQADIALDHVSSVNTDPLLSLSGTQENKIPNVDTWIKEACDVLALMPSERHPLDLAKIPRQQKKKRNKATYPLLLVTSSPWRVLMVSAVGIGAAAMLISNNPQLLSSWA